MFDLLHLMVLNMFFVGVFMMIYFFNHLLMILIVMEFIVVLIILSLFCILIEFKISVFFVIYFLIMSVCEGALGLSLIAMMVRFYGNDYFKSGSLLKW